MAAGGRGSELTVTDDAGRCLEYLRGRPAGAGGDVPGMNSRPPNEERSRAHYGQT
jgi:hypothetical protein